MSKIQPIPAEILVDRYLSAKETVVRSGFAAEIDWQDQRRLEKVTEAMFLRETAWVILSSGMREAVIRQRFSDISLAFLNWISANEIVRHSRQCKQKAIAVFQHVRKIDAIITSAKMLATMGLEHVKSQIDMAGVNALRTFPFIGPVTAWHLAKNLGLDVVKPDRHLCRISEAAGFASPLELCKVISDRVGDRLAVVDVVLWRFATLQRDYISFFRRQGNTDDGYESGFVTWEIPSHRRQCQSRMCA